MAINFFSAPFYVKKKFDWKEKWQQRRMN